MVAPRTVGIIGGMGPAATVLLMQRVIASVDGDDDRDHVPLIVDNNTQVPSRLDALLLGTGDDPWPVLAHMARRLRQAGAEALAMPCNTAHHYASQIATATDIPLLDMVALSATAARRRAGPDADIGIIGSPALRRIAVCDAALAAAGLRPIYPTDEPALLAAIRTIKAGGPDPAAAAAIEVAARDLLDRGAALCLIACTEFSLLTDALDEGLPLIDTLDVLVGAIHDFAFSAKPRLARPGDPQEAPGLQPAGEGQWQ